MTVPQAEIDTFHLRTNFRRILPLGRRRCLWTLHTVARVAFGNYVYLGEALAELRISMRLGEALAELRISTRLGEALAELRISTRSVAGDAFGHYIWCVNPQNDGTAG